jgi:glycosyltransferase involved in cell wall biosynthesis
MLWFYNNISLSAQIILWILIISFAIQLFYYLFFFSRLIFHRTVRKNAPLSPVSIITCVRDEAHNLKKFLPSILKQDYKNYEVIVVNDCSKDNTGEILEDFQKKYRHLRVSTIKEDSKFSHGKKFALFIGIKAAKNEWLLLTDSDCFAITNQWLSTMQKNFTKKTSIVLGYGKYQTEKGILNKYIRCDSVFIAMQYLSFALAGFPYMGVGRNLAYRKSLFLQNKGFSSHINLSSGDDDLFINKLAKKTNTKVELNQKSFTCSKPETSIKEWIKQKRRHLTTGRYYKTRDKFLLGAEVVSRMLFYLSFIYILIIKIPFEVPLAVFLFRMIIQLTVFKFTMLCLHEKFLLLSSLLYDFISPFLNFGLFLSNLSSAENNKWK